MHDSPSEIKSGDFVLALHYRLVFRFGVILCKAGAQGAVVCEEGFLGGTLTGFAGGHAEGDGQACGVLCFGGDVGVLFYDLRVSGLCLVRPGRVVDMF